MSSVYDIGNLVHVGATFRDANGQRADPNVVKLSVRTPGGTTTTYIYGTDDEVVRVSLGRFSSDIDADAAGTWYYRWWSTGDGQAADEGEFIVNAAHAV